jgi:hypothetical protein
VRTAHQAPTADHQQIAMRDVIAQAPMQAFVPGSGAWRSSFAAHDVERRVRPDGIGSAQLPFCAVTTVTGTDTARRSRAGTS